MSLTHAIKWSFLSEIASKAITPLVLVVLARLLTPEDYGVVAAATMVITFSQVFWEAGLSKALIQFQGDRVAAANAAFWLNCVLGLGVVGAIVASSGLVASHIFHDPRVALVLRVMSLQVVLSALVSVHVASLQKDMHFKRLFWVRMATTTAPGLLSIPLAWAGAGYWALVAGTLLGQAIQVPLVWRLTAWSPSFSFDSAVARRLAHFSKWVIVSGLAGWFYVWADSLIVGWYLGAHELGLYRTGNAFIMTVYALLIGPVLPALYSHLSGVQHDSEKVRQTLAKVIRTITVISVPLGFLIYSMSEPIAQIVFGTGWHGVGLVIAIMGLTHGFAWIVGANGEAYRAIGRPDFETKIMVAALPLYCLAYWASVRYGLETFLWARFAIALVAIGSHFWLARLAVGLNVLGTLAHIGKIAAIGIPLVVIHHSSQFADSTLASQLSVGVCAGLWILGALWLVERNALIPETVGMLKKSLRL